MTDAQHLGVTDDLNRQHEPEDRPTIAQLPTPIGPIWTATTRRGLAALWINPAQGRATVDAELQRRGLADAGGDPGLSSNTHVQLQEYFDGSRRSFDLPIDLRGMPAFTTAVLTELQSVGFGATRTYGEMARALSKPGASRAVGQANGRNPVAIVVPCHRVVASNGLGGFGAGLDVKRWLLRHEGRGELCE